MTNKPISRRAALSGLATAGAAGLAAPSLATAQGQTTTWKVQTSWPGGTGLAVRDWLRSQGYDPQPRELPETVKAWLAAPPDMD